MAGIRDIMHHMSCVCPDKPRKVTGGGDLRAFKGLSIQLRLVKFAYSIMTMCIENNGQ